MASELNFKREMKRAFRRLPYVAVFVTVGLVGGLGLIVAIGTVVVLQFTSNPQQQQASQVLASGSGRAQAIIGVADCLIGNQCPNGRNPDEDVKNLVAATSTINGSTFTNLKGDAWKKWAEALMRYGRLDQDSVHAVSAKTGTGQETIQVDTTQGTTMICDLNWSGIRKLSSWQCYADAPAPSTATSSRGRGR